MCWEQDLKLSDVFEKLTIKIYNMKNYERKNFNFKEYDIEDLDTKIKYEVKTDRMTNDTGNIIIEYECNNKPSGINATTADYYIYYILDEANHKYGYYEIPVSKIKKYIKNNKYHQKISGGDGNRMKGYLFKVETFEKYLMKTCA